MSTNRDDLTLAKNRQMLVNVFQKDEEIVYTGFVDMIGEDGIVLNTFDDLGRPDGAVFLRDAVIDEVEFSSDDLDNMAFRIHEDVSQGGDAVGIEHTYVPNQPLLVQVLGQARVDNRAVMINLMGENTAYEGMIRHINEQSIVIAVLDKFNYTRRKTMTVMFDQIKIVEFDGHELLLQGQIFDDMMALDHVERVSEKTPDEMMKALQTAEKTQRMVLITPDPARQYFFVGTINTLNADAMVMNFVTMNGRFGGYILLRLSEIHSVTTTSDYLQTINLYRQTTQLFNVPSDPVLNDERLFDPKDDLFVEILHQAANFKNVVRLELSDLGNLTGYPSHVGDGHVIFHQVDEGKIVDPMGVALSLDKIDEVSFGYKDAYMTERKLKAEGDL